MKNSVGGSTKNQKAKSNQIQLEKKNLRFINSSSEALFFSEMQSQNMEEAKHWLKSNPNGVLIDRR